MNRKEAAELLPIIKAFSEGKEVQYKSNGSWYSAENIVFFGETQRFRIKPEPKYRPFRDAEECWKGMQKHPPFGWVKDKKNGHHVLITAVDDDTCGMSLNGNAAWSLSGIMDLFTFADGVPFGVKVEE